MFDFKWKENGSIKLLIIDWDKTGDYPSGSNY